MYVKVVNQISWSPEENNLSLVKSKIMKIGSGDVEEKHT